MHGLTAAITPAGPPRWVGVVFVFVSSAFLLQGMYILRDRQWRERGWWARHPMLAFCFAGFRRLERPLALLEVISATVMILVGLALLIVR